MSTLVRSYAPYSWPKRLAIFFGLPLGVCVPIVVILKLLDPVHAIDCRRGAPAAEVSCEVTEHSWASDPPPRAFVLDGASVEVRRVESHSRRGTSSRLHLEITPVGEAPLELQSAGEPTRAALRAMLGDPQQLAFHHDDDKSDFFAAMFPIAFLLVSIPLLALGGRIDLAASPRRISVTRTRAWIRGRERVIESRAGLPIVLDVHHHHGRWRGMGRLSARVGDATTVLVAQAPSAVVEQLAADLRGALEHAHE